jgi:DNA-binding MarR family transcriptional regulator
VSPRPRCTLGPIPIALAGGDHWFMVHHDIREGPSPAVAQATLDRILELFERRKLSATELRVLLALIDRGAGVSDLAEALDQSPAEITRAGRSLSMRGLIRWHHVGLRKETRFDITCSGLTTVRALLTALTHSSPALAGR